MLILPIIILLTLPITVLLEGRCNASKASILASYMDSIDDVVRDMELELPGYE